MHLAQKTPKFIEVAISIYNPSSGCEVQMDRLPPTTKAGGLNRSHDTSQNMISPWPRIRFC